MIRRVKLRRRSLFATAASLLTLFCLTGLCTPRAWAQASNASLAGVVSDPSGGVVPAAKVTLTDVVRALRIQPPQMKGDDTCCELSRPAHTGLRWRLPASRFISAREFSSM